MISRGLKLFIKVLPDLVEGYHKKRNIASTEAAQRAGVNPISLQQGYKQLVLAGIIESRNGRDNPGYKIIRDPKEITLLEVLKALEVFPRMQCTHKNKNGSECLVCGIKNKAMSQIEAEYASISLSLVEIK